MESIGERVKSEVFDLFRKGLFLEAEKMLRQLSFQLTGGEDTETKRLVLRNLSWVLDKNGNKELSKKYARVIKQIVDNDKSYRETNIEGLCDVMNLYSEFIPEEVTDKEKIDINKVNYEVYCHDLNNLDRSLMALSNIYIYEGNFYDVQYVIETIHSYEGKVIFDDEEKNKTMLAKLREVKCQILKDTKNRCPDYIYDEIMRDLFKPSNTVTAM